MLPSTYIASYRRLRNLAIGPLPSHPLPDAMSRMPLFARRLPILLQDPINELFHRFQPRSFSLYWLAFRRNRALQCLPHHSPVHVQLVSYSSDSAYPVFILPSDLLKQLHLRSPVQPAPPWASDMPSRVASSFGVGPN